MFSCRHLQEWPLPGPSQSPTTPRAKHLVRHTTCLWRGYESTRGINGGYMRTPPYLSQGTSRARLDTISLQRILELVSSTKRETRGRANAEGARRGGGFPHLLLPDGAETSAA